MVTVEKENKVLTCQNLFTPVLTDLKRELILESFFFFFTYSSHKHSRENHHHHHHQKSLSGNYKCQQSIHS